jgi:hypothetical protein
MLLPLHGSTASKEKMIYAGEGKFHDAKRVKTNIGVIKEVIMDPNFYWIRSSSHYLFFLQYFPH